MLWLVMLRCIAFLGFSPVSVPANADNLGQTFRSGGLSHLPARADAVVVEPQLAIFLGGSLDMMQGCPGA